MQHELAHVEQMSESLLRWLTRITSHFCCSILHTYKDLMTVKVFQNYFLWREVTVYYHCVWLQVQVERVAPRLGAACYSVGSFDHRVHWRSLVIFAKVWEITYVDDLFISSKLNDRAKAPLKREIEVWRPQKRPRREVGVLNLRKCLEICDVAG